MELGTQLSCTLPLLIADFSSTPIRPTKQPTEAYFPALKPGCPQGRRWCQMAAATAWPSRRLSAWTVCVPEHLTLEETQVPWLTAARSQVCAAQARARVTPTLPRPCSIARTHSLDP